NAYGIHDVTDLVANPPALVIPTGAQPGDHITFDMSGSGETIHVVEDFVRTETLIIGGQSVTTVLSHQVATLSGKAVGTTTTDDWISLNYSLIVKEHTVSDITAYGTKARTDQTFQLQSLAPQ